MSDATDTQTQPAVDRQPEPEPVDANRQVTSKIPITQPATAKNPKRVATVKAVAERTRRAREAQKKPQLKPLS